MSISALDYATIGWQVFPCHSIVRGRCSCGDADCTSPGKHPRTSRGFKEATTDPQTIRSWWNHWPDANIGVRTGRDSGIVVIDIDPRHGGFDSYDELLTEVDVPDTLTSKTGGGGRHVILRYPESGTIRGRNNWRPGIDVKSDGGYIVAPPSNHKSGGRYEWENWGSDIANIPEPLLRSIIGTANERAAEDDFKVPTIDQLLDGVPEGERDNTFFKWACSYRRKNGDGSKSGALALAYIAAAQCDPPFPRDQVEKCINSAWKQDHSDYDRPLRLFGTGSGFEPLSDLGNANRFVENFGQDFRYVSGMGWMKWTSNHWERDTSASAHHKAKAVSSIIREEAEKIDPEEDRRAHQQHVKWSISSQSSGAINAIVSVAQSDPRINKNIDEFDIDTKLIGVRNGVIDLQTSEMRNITRDDLMTKNTDVLYDPSVDQSYWLEFLDTALNHDQEMIKYLQRAAGYTLTGETSEEVFFIISGPQASGKSTFLDGMQAAMGNYATSSQSDTFMYRRNQNQNKEEIARLAGYRLVTVSEIREGDNFDEALVKQFTGGDKVTARFLYQDTFEFRPQFKLWVGTNHDPGAHDDAIWRRIKKIPFPITVPVEKRDPRLKSWVRNPETGGRAVLAWMVEGAREWIAHGLSEPESIKREVESYRQTQDRDQAFFAEMTRHSPGAVVPLSDMYSTYVAWCEKYRDYPKKFPVFKQMFDRREDCEVFNNGNQFYVRDMESTYSVEGINWGV